VNVHPSPLVTISPLKAPAFVYCASDSVTLKATSSTATSYAWYKGGVLISGATEDTLSVKSTADFQVIVKDVYGCADTDVVSVLENPLPLPTLSPKDVFICEGVDIMLHCSPAHPNYKYQWYKNNVDMGIDTTLYETPTHSSGLYHLTVTDYYKCVRNTNKISVTIYPPITVPTIVRIGNILKVGATYTTYQWYRNNTIIPGATSNIYNMVFDGKYFVKVSDKNGCESVSDTLNYDKLGIVANKHLSFKIYPNPTNSVVYVDAPVKATVKVTDIMGRLIVDSTDAKEINLESVADGTYLIKVLDQDGNYLGSEQVMKVTR
jgi:large repetitive protein